MTPGGLPGALTRGVPTAGTSVHHRQSTGRTDFTDGQALTVIDVLGHSGLIGSHVPTVHRCPETRSPSGVPVRCRERLVHY